MRSIDEEERTERNRHAGSTEDYLLVVDPFKAKISV